MKKWLFAVLMMVSGLANAAIVEGKDYVVLATPQPVSTPGKVEVIEFFSYHCVHCFHLEPFITPWSKKLAKDVSFRREQIVWGKQMEPLARLFATFKVTNTLERLHGPAITAMVQQHVDLTDEAATTKWLATQPGVNTKAFMQAYKSFGVNAQVARSTQITRDYAIQGTPTIVVAGKYATVAAEPAQLLKVVDELIVKARSGK
ncbi:thiol:disulfide interchange protein DsbA/DsbL [Vogesella sp. LIG4]|uniref:thiol:disulfide interchange protein DsbA/DsbL n=1 Tax=Vogesella sp. LIG4 TaxID=1192162 RepID=UPI00081FE271|nr:thiol:disulfide interchange protein DsbA/DsbL [Vogesella sp. LIG4]SCK09221.1 Thiol:disulfide interchange protein DsbA [Vogesella sp. LIG4]